MKAVVLLRRRRAPRSARHEGCEKKKAMSSSTSSSGKVRKDGRKEGGCNQCDQIRRFLKVLGYIFSNKSGPNNWLLSRLLWKAILFE